MIDRCLKVLSPHICEGCGAVGSPLCERCNFYILQHRWKKCVGCGRLMTTAELARRGNMCGDCDRALPFKRVDVIGERNGALKKLVGNYKYFSRRESAKVLAGLLAAALPEEKSDFVIVPLPTIPEHVRTRGFDHMKLVARELSRLKNLRCDPELLRRTNNLSQHSANLGQRKKQAATAFMVNPRRPVPERILLIDDIYTTGATTAAAAKLLKKHGAKEVRLVVAARQVRSE